MPRRLLIVDDDPTIRTSLSEALADNGTTEVRVAEGPHRALTMLDELGGATPDVVLSDVRMPGMDGDQAMRVIWSERPTPCIFISAYSKPLPCGDGLDSTECVFLTKPVSRDELEGAIDQLATPNHDGEPR